MTLSEILHYRFLGNDVQTYLIALAILLFGLLFKNLMSRLLTKLLYRFVRGKSEGVTEDQFHELLIQPVSLVIFLTSLYLAFQILNIPVRSAELARSDPWYEVAIFRLYQICIISSIAWIITRFIDFFVLVFLRRAEASPRVANQLVPFARDLLKFLVGAVAFLIILGKTFGVDVTALIGGLGIGGLAVAFAAKESLENLLASFTIFLDRPFIVGDLVSVGDITGTIEQIGFRSTRLRTVEKSYVTVPNKSMIDKPLDNLSLRTARRVFFMMSLRQNTSNDQLHSIVNQAFEAINTHPLIQPDAQVKFTSLTSNSKDIRIQYYVATDSYDEYLNVMEEINFKLVEIVERNDSSFVDTTRLTTTASGSGTGSTALPRSLQSSPDGSSVASS
ncbi:mechanosensitive ion channel family protein [Hymenobacter sp. BT507]|uniref:Mechanosensitive ion channel family protein n=1 Tax=Hymenobacter citatus TaxID=2763506 RepID=A0ABR7MNS8_9BACT|nr:mechanosensitive ion channel family protein [Hymenobacter citatus]MBC6612370.1 mechanosensitive ion channel family protein [Hymenobacter citatus]